MSTVSEACTQALQRIGVLAANETASSTDLSTAFDVLNELQDAWAVERLLIPYTKRTTWTIAASTTSYTVGTGATVNVARPTFIDHVTYLDSSLTTPVEIELAPLTPDAYAGYGQKTLTSVYPVYAYYQPTYSATGTLYLLPIPTSTTLTGVIYTPLALGEFSATSDTLTVPFGYRRFLVTNLALELAPLFGAVPSDDLRQQANEAKAAVKRSNITLSDLSLDAGALQGNAYGSYLRFLSGP